MRLAISVYMKNTPSHPRRGLGSHCNHPDKPPLSALRDVALLLESPQRKAAKSLPVFSPSVSLSFYLPASSWRLSPSGEGNSWCFGRIMRRGRILPTRGFPAQNFFRSSVAAPELQLLGSREFCQAAETFARVEALSVLK